MFTGVSKDYSAFFFCIIYLPPLFTFTVRHVPQSVNLPIGICLCVEDFKITIYLHTAVFTPQ